LALLFAAQERQNHQNTHKLCTGIGLPHFTCFNIGFVFSDSSFVLTAGRGTLHDTIGFVLSQPADRRIAIISFGIRAYADLRCRKLALFFQIAC
jgi:hypothetical protein